jgi:hypothetical protein
MLKGARERAWEGVWEGKGRVGERGDRIEEL